MREILFRGQRIPNREWVEGILMPACDTYPAAIFYSESKENGYKDGCYVYEDTVGQFTGLLDKNGKKVFEGDVLHFWSEYHEAYVGKCVVKYGKFNCSCCDGVYGWYLDGGDIRYLMDGEMWYEICGTIHDNPELLEG